MTDAAPAVAARDLEVVYQRGGEPGVSGLTLTIGPGRGLLVTGDEGAGKTTLLRAVLGTVVAAGELTVFGAHPGAPALRGRIGYGPQGKTFAEGHPPRALIRTIVAIRRGRPDHALAEQALDRAGLAPGRRASRVLDVEELRRVSLACAIAADPDLLVLDDPWEFPETVAEIRAARDRGAAVLAASPDPGGLPALLGATLRLAGGRAT